MEQDALQSLIGSVLNTKLAQWLTLNNDVFYTYKTKYSAPPLLCDTRSQIHTFIDFLDIEPFIIYQKEKYQVIETCNQKFDQEQKSPVTTINNY